MSAAGLCYKENGGVACNHWAQQGVWTGVTNLVAMTSNAPPDLLTEFYVAHYTGLVRLAALLLDEPARCSGS